MFETKLIIEPTTLALSDHTVATVIITGTQPLHVEVPKFVLDEATSSNWKLTSNRPASLQHIGSNYVWEQQYQLSPFVVGSRLKVQFNEFLVNQKPLTIPQGEVTVSTSIQSLTSADVRPITPLEMTHPNTAANFSLAMISGALVVIGLLFSGIVAYLWLRRKTITTSIRPIESLRHDLLLWVAVEDKSVAIDLARRIRHVFAEPCHPEQLEHFSRLDRWQYSKDIPTIAEMQAELDYWRVVVGQTTEPPS